jgi:recombinational DNA repair protein (RecF pathway)
MTETEVKEFVLSALDRCDACGSQAYVKATGVAGDLLFCAHHFGKIENDPAASVKMLEFAFDLIDEREKLIENRLKGDD